MTVFKPAMNLQTCNKMSIRQIIVYYMYFGHGRIFQ